MVKKLQARNEPRKGRGFGFVTLESEELQTKAVNEMNGKEIEGREIAVKVAIDSPDKQDDESAPSAEAGTENTPGMYYYLTRTVRLCPTTITDILLAAAPVEPTAA